MSLHSKDIHVHEPTEEHLDDHVLQRVRMSIHPTGTHVRVPTEERVSGHLPRHMNR